MLFFVQRNDSLVLTFTLCGSIQPTQIDKSAAMASSERTNKRSHSEHQKGMCVCVCVCACVCVFR